MRLQAVFPALTERNVRLYTLGQGLSVLSLWSQNVTLNLVMYKLTDSASALALLNFLLYGATLVVAPIAASRMPIGWVRRSSIICVLVYAFTGVVTGLAVFFDLVTPTGLLIAALICGVCSAIEIPSRQLFLIASLKDPKLTANAVAMNTMVYNTGRMTGPALAGFLFNFAGPSAGFFVYAVTSTITVMCSLGMTLEQLERRGGIKASFSDAVRYAMQDRFAGIYLPLLVCTTVFGASYQTLVPLLADRTFGQAATYTGLFFSAAAAGALVAGIVLSSQWGRMATQRLLPYAPWACAASLLVIGLPVPAWGATAGFLLLGFSLTFTSTSINATLQQRCPPQLSGGMLGLYQMAFGGVLPFGFLFAGTISENFPVGTTFIILAVCLSLAIVGIKLLRR